MKELDLILKNQERFEEKFDEHVKTSSQQHTEMRVMLEKGTNRMAAIEKLQTEDHKFIEDAKKIMYKTVGAAMVISLLIGIIIKLI